MWAYLSVSRLMWAYLSVLRLMWTGFSVLWLMWACFSVSVTTDMSLFVSVTADVSLFVSITTDVNRFFSVTTDVNRFFSVTSDAICRPMWTVLSVLRWRTDHVNRTVILRLNVKQVSVYPALFSRSGSIPSDSVTRKLATPSPHSHFSFLDLWTHVIDQLHVYSWRATWFSVSAAVKGSCRRKFLVPACVVHVT